MSTIDVERIRQIKTLPSLIKFLRDDLDWPIEADATEDVAFFDYTAEELGIDAKHAPKIREIKQLRPLDTNQPWGIFWVSFEKKRLPMVVLRRILGNLVKKKWPSLRKADRPSWDLHDLLFISSYGEEEHRTLSFAHFTEDPTTEELPVLRVLGWDDQNSVMQIDRVANSLHSHFRWPSDPEDVTAWRKRWSEAFTDRYREAIRSADQLIPRLAALASSIRRRVRDVLEAETDRGPMRRLFAAVQGLLIHDMSEDGFADMYAQTVAYGLLSASFSRPADITPQNLVQLTAISNPFLKDLLDSLFRLNRGKSYFDVDEVGINDVLDLLRNTNIEAIKAAFNDLNPAEDPVIRFYEGFLKAYDSEQRVKRGVFFTPRPVVSYIVRSVHELLQTEFGLEDGLASTATWADMLRKFPSLQPPKDVKPDDSFVLILDPATGTGTFLSECIETIERTMKTKWARALGKRNPESRSTWDNPQILSQWCGYVSKHLLPRLHGFEIMMAPYAIAHVKLALKLGETGYQFRDGDRLNIYLTNTLEPPSDIADARLADLFGPLAREAQEVNHIKRTRRFTVLIGNPPYSGESANRIPWARDLVKSKYEYIDGARIQEKGKKNWLLNDYVKFTRFAHFVAEQSQLALIGFITPHSFLDNPTFRAMRNALIDDFYSLFLLDLHGNYDKREKCPDGSKDENVFEITQGVCISILQRKSLGESAQRIRGKIYLNDLWGLREPIKYPWLLRHSSRADESTRILPDERFYFFRRGGSKDDKYESWWPLNKIFSVNGNGVITAHDHFSIAFDDGELAERLDTYINPRLTDDEVLKRLELKENSMWEINESRISLRRSRSENRFVGVLYRPFDVRRTFFHKSVVFNLRLPVMKHMVAGGNIAIICSRMTKGESFAHAFVSRTISEAILLSSKTSNNAFSFPLRLKNDGGEVDMFNAPEDVFHDNLSAKFLADFRAKLQRNGIAEVCDIQSQEVFNYLYALLNSPGYRSRYAEFLKIDFPRLPFTGNLELFRSLGRLGGELVALHLLESPKLDHPITKNLGGRAPGVEKVSWSKDTVWLDKAQTTGFEGVPEDVWNFHIGGYQVCEKWLKDRKGRQLSKEDIAHYQKIVVALAETIKIMAEIDKTIETHGGWPIK